MFPVLLDIYLGELSGHMVNLRLIFEKLPNSFAKQQHRSTFPAAVYEGSDFSATNTCYLPFIIAILVSVKYLSMILISIFLI